MLILIVLRPMGDDADRNPPSLIQYSPWSQRIDHIQTSFGWKQMKVFSAEHGLVSIAYTKDQTYSPYRRLYQFAKLFLFVPDSAVYGCPLSMTDGAANILSTFTKDNALFESAYHRLISRNPEEFWTSGQWMTERPGGSDVSQTETIAVQDTQDNNIWNIHGFKWFSSATDADATLLLARTHDPTTGELMQGSRGLSLFFAEMKNDKGELNGVRVHRLKQKFGTKAVPTAELELVGMRAHLVGPLHRGVATISTLLNITRIHAAISVASYLDRCHRIAKQYATMRYVQGKPLTEHELHVKHLALTEIISRGAIQLAFYAVYLLNQSETGNNPGYPTNNNTELQIMLRITTPLAKLWIAKEACQEILECMEALGGQGYMEDATEIARRFSDAQVNAIWEGTTNVLALDVWRVLRGGNQQAIDIFSNVSFRVLILCLV